MIGSRFRYFSHTALLLCAAYCALDGQADAQTGGRPTHSASTQVAVQARRPAVARIELAPPEKEKLLAGDSIPVSATAFDAAGQPLPLAKLTFRVSPAFTGKVAKGRFTAARAGTAQIVAVNGRVSSNPISVIVNQVGNIVISPGGPLTLFAGDTFVFSAQCYDVAGTPLPNADYPVVPLVWKSSGGNSAPITPRGALITRRRGAVSVSAVAGKTRSALVRVNIRPREQGATTRLFLTGQPVAGLQSLFLTFQRLEIAKEDGSWHTLATKEQIDALVGQPIDVQRLWNQRVQIGTGFLPDGDYRRLRMTFSTEPGANYLVRADGTHVPLEFTSPEAAVKEVDYYLFVLTGSGYPLNAVFDVLSLSSLVSEEDGSILLDPIVDTLTLDDQELARPFGSLVGQIQPVADAMEVYATNFDDGGAISNFFGTIDPTSGIFRIGQLPAGLYELRVYVPGFPVKLITPIRILAAQDNMLPAPVTFP